jgi:hypothetical protein
MWVFLAISGCDRGTSKCAQRLVGTWRVDMEKTEPMLFESLKDAKPTPAVDLETREAHIASVRSFTQAKRLTICETHFERWSGDKVDKSRYEVLEGGDDHVLLRHYPDGERRYNDMTFQEIVDSFQGNVTNVPMCMGVKLLDEDHIQMFRLKVENGKAMLGQPLMEVYERIPDPQ